MDIYDGFIGTIHQSVMITSMMTSIKNKKPPNRPRNICAKMKCIFVPVINQSHNDDRIPVLPRLPQRPINPRKPQGCDDGTRHPRIPTEDISGSRHRFSQTFKLPRLAIHSGEPYRHIYGIGANGVQLRLPFV